MRSPSLNRFTFYSQTIKPWCKSSKLTWTIQSKIGSCGSANLSVFAWDEAEPSPMKRRGAATPCQAAQHSHHRFSWRGMERWMEREKMSGEKEGSWERQIETGCWFLWKTVFCSLLPCVTRASALPPPPPACITPLSCSQEGRKKLFRCREDLGRRGRVWWYFTVFLFFFNWEVAIGSFQSRDWWCDGGGGTRRYQLPHCHLRASWLVNTVPWGWEAWTVTEVEILASVLQVPAGGQQGWGWGGRRLIWLFHHIATFSGLSELLSGRSFSSLPHI